GDAQIGAELRLLKDDGHPPRAGLGSVPRGEGGASELDGARVGGDGPRQDLHQGALAGAVLTEHRVDLARLGGERDPAPRPRGAEGILEARHPKQRPTGGRRARSAHFGGARSFSTSGDARFFWSTRVLPVSIAFSIGSPRSFFTIVVTPR